jgi:hypothetical protein
VGTTAEQKVKALREALFPEARKNEDGVLIFFDADEDLAAALYDLKRLQADKVCISTIERVLGRLRTVRSILEEN